MVTYRQNGYSVPWRHIGSVLPVRVTENELIIYGPQVEEIARHRAVAAHGHRAAERAQGAPAHRGSRGSAQAQLQERFAELGATAAGSWRACCQRSVTARTRRSGCWRCWGRYARADLIAALERAVRYGAYSHAAVERILAVQAQPKSVLETLAEEQRRRCPPGWATNRCRPGPRRTTNTSATRSRPA